MRLLFLGLAVATLSACASLPAPFNQSPFDSGPPPAAAPAPTVDANGAPVAAPLTRQQQELADAERRLFAQGQEQGLGTAMGNAMEPDGFIVRSGSILTSANVSELNTPSSPIFAQTDRIHVSNDGTMGMTSGRYVQVRTGAEALLGRYVVVWRKDVNGQWRVLSESRTADPSRVASSTPPATLTTRR